MFYRNILSVKKKETLLLLGRKTNSLCYICASLITKNIIIFSSRFFFNRTYSLFLFCIESKQLPWTFIYQKTWKTNKYFIVRLGMVFKWIKINILGIQKSSIIWIIFVVWQNWCNIYKHIVEFIYEK